MSWLSLIFNGGNWNELLNKGMIWFANETKNPMFILTILFVIFLWFVWRWYSKNKDKWGDYETIQLKGYIK